MDNDGEEPDWSRSASATGEAPRSGVDDEVDGATKHGTENEDVEAPEGNANLGTGVSANPLSFIPMFGRSFGNGVQYCKSQSAFFRSISVAPIMGTDHGFSWAYNAASEMLTSGNASLNL